MSTPVTTQRHRADAMTECEQCGLGNFPVDAAPRAVRDHVAETGHVVRMVVEETTIYRAESRT